MNTKICIKCRITKSHADFYKNKRMKDGLNTFCILCHKADNVARKKANRQNPKFVANEYAQKKIYRKENREKIAIEMFNWREKNAGHVKEYAKKYRQENKTRCNYLCQKRKIDLINRTPKWLDEDDLWIIEQAYDIATKRSAATGIQWHVDHIIPLRGKYVSGLHVPTNLQVITWYENQRKTNKFEVDRAS